MESFYYNEYFLRSVVESAPFPIGVYMGNELRIVLANQAMMDTWGKGNDVLGKLYTEILPELENQEIFEQSRGVLSTGVQYHAKDARVDLMINGAIKTHYFNYSFTPLYDAEGKIYGVMNTGADVTDLNIARQQTKDAEDRLRLAIESAHLGIYETDLITGEVVTSGNFNQIWDFDGKVTKDEIIKRLHPEDLSVRDEAHKKASPNGNISYDARIFHRDNSIHWIRINGKVIHDENGIPYRLIGFAQDITSQMQFTLQLSDLVEQRTMDLQRSNGDLMQFAHIVSHDLKEPVRKVKSSMTYLKIDLLTILMRKQRNTLKKYSLLRIA